MSHEGSREDRRAQFSHHFRHEGGTLLTVDAELEKRAGEKRTCCWVVVNDGVEFVRLTGHMAVYFADALTDIAEINPTIPSPTVKKRSGEIGDFITPGYEEEAQAIVLLPQSAGLSQARILSSQAQFHGCIDRIVEMSESERQEYHREVAESLLPAHSPIAEKTVTGPIVDLLWYAHQHKEFKKLLHDSKFPPIQ